MNDMIESSKTRLSRSQLEVQEPNTCNRNRVQFEILQLVVPLPSAFIVTPISRLFHALSPYFPSNFISLMAQYNPQCLTAGLDIDSTVLLHVDSLDPSNFTPAVSRNALEDIPYMTIHKVGRAGRMPFADKSHDFAVCCKDHQLSRTVSNNPSLESLYRF